MTKQLTEKEEQAIYGLFNTVGKEKTHSNYDQVYYEKTIEGQTYNLIVALNDTYKKNNAIFIDLCINSYTTIIEGDSYTCSKDLLQFLTDFHTRNNTVEKHKQDKVKLLDKLASNSFTKNTELDDKLLVYEKGHDGMLENRDDIILIHTESGETLEIIKNTGEIL